MAAFGIAALGFLLAGPLSTPLDAQDYRWSFTGYAGAAAYSSLADSADPGVELAPSGFYGGMAELWLGRVGFRLHTGFAGTHVDGDEDIEFGLFATDADVLLRFRRRRPGLVFQPYGVLGFGAIRYDVSPDTSLVGGYPYESDPELRGTMVLGIGADFFDGPLGLKLELMDIIGFTSPLSRDDTSSFGPVSHVVLTFGLSLRAGYLALPSAPRRPRPRPTPISPTEPRDTAPRPPAPAPTDTVRVDTVRVDTVRVDTVRPFRPPPVDTVAVDTTTPPPQGPPPQPPDTVRRPPPGQPIDTTRVPVDTVRRPPIHPPPPPVDTVETPTDTTEVEPPDTTEVEPPDTTEVEPPDTTGVEPPVDTTDTGEGETRGRLFAVRLAWTPGDAASATAVNALVAVLQQAGVPVWPAEPAGPEAGEPLTYRRVAALRNAADARTLGNHIEAEYGLEWEWVHIGMDEDVSPEAVAASTAFVDGLPEGPGREGRGGPPGGGDGA